ncbi:MAG: hypothetical protein U0V64_08160 [Cyclobacteriaceae bacterium]
MKRAKWRPDFIVAALAVMIGLLTMIVYIYQARVMSRQLHASVWPYLEVVFSQGEAGLAIYVINKGVGPAMVRQNEILVDGVRWTEDTIDSLLVSMVGRPINRTFTTVQGSVVMAGEKIPFLLVPTPADAVALDSAFRHHRLEMRLCYCSIYDDCWRTDNGRVQPCDDCQ